MKNSDLYAESFAFILTAMQSHQLFQTISLILTIIATLFSIFQRIITWYKNAKKDNKITKEELEDLLNKIEEDIKKEE